MHGEFLQHGETKSGANLFRFVLKGGPLCFVISVNRPPKVEDA